MTQNTNLTHIMYRMGMILFIIWIVLSVIKFSILSDYDTVMGRNNIMLFYASLTYYVSIIMRQKISLIKCLGVILCFLPIIIDATDAVSRLVCRFMCESISVMDMCYTCTYYTIYNNLWISIVASWVSIFIWTLFGNNREYFECEPFTEHQFLSLKVGVTSFIIYICLCWMMSFTCIYVITRPIMHVLSFIGIMVITELQRIIVGIMNINNKKQKKQ
jgi:hypothetical protein